MCSDGNTNNTLSWDVPTLVKAPRLEEKSPVNVDVQCALHHSSLFPFSCNETRSDWKKKKPCGQLWGGFFICHNWRDFS